MRSSPVLGDVDNDSKLEVVVGSDDYKIYAFNPVPSGERIYWQGLSGNTTFSRQKNLEAVDPDLDMLSSYSETRIYFSDPEDPDTDKDGLSDGDEVLNYGTDPLDTDTDGDGFFDGIEVASGTDPLDPNNYPGAQPPTQPSPSIQGYNIYILMGVVAVSTLILIKKKIWASRTKKV